MQTKRPDPSVEGEPVLVIATPGGLVKQQRFGLAETLVVGRDAGAAINIADDSVSRRHAEFRARPLAVRDLGSTNGTRVQGHPISGEWTELAIGGLVELGDVVVLVRSSQALGGVGDDAIRPERRDDRRPVTDELIAVSPQMQRLCSLVELIGPSRLSVLILGETGAGKEVIARAIHRASDRSAHRMLAINCAAIAPTLLESELFGFDKGAFTGATQAKAGLLESASGGTLFLDEIGEMPLETQAKLLRVLESGELLRVGGRDPITVDVRVVAATHRDLVALAATAEFRLDLLFRISGVTLAVPPLRERPDDIVPLAEFFLGNRATALSDAARDALRNHAWPGNVRELKNTVERAELLSRGGAIEVSHLSFGIGVAVGAPPPSPPAAAATIPEEVAALERDRILAALEACGGNQSRAAKLLGVSRAKLVRRLDAYGVTRPRK
jgi:transcriptional regulator with PAS, ATPase and Fis domain